MYKDFIGWAKDPEKTETKYLIESIRDKKIWDKFLRTEDIDLYEKREYDNIADALQFYLTWYVSEKCYDIKMWQQVFVNGEMILEEFVEPKNTTKFTMHEALDREMNTRMRSAETETERLRKSNELMSGFIKVMGKQFQDMFEEYCEREEKKNE